MSGGGYRRIELGSCSWCGHEPHGQTCSRSIRTATSEAEPCPLRQGGDDVTTIYVSDDRSFQIRTGSVCTPRPRCRHIQPDVIDFPGICDRAPGHNGDHQAAAAWGGSLGQFPPIQWRRIEESE